MFGFEGNNAREKGIVLLTMCFALAMAMLDNTVVNVALPTIRNDLGAGFSQLQWIVDAYALAFASLLLTGGILGDRYGRIFMAFSLCSRSRAAFHHAEPADRRAHCRASAAAHPRAVSSLDSTANAQGVPTPPLPGGLPVGSAGVGVLPAGRSASSRSSRWRSRIGPEQRKLASWV
jgi:MFS family permease